VKAVSYPLDALYVGFTLKIIFGRMICYGFSLPNHYTEMGRASQPAPTCRMADWLSRFTH
jgi:hypothetical protein